MYWLDDVKIWEDGTSILIFVDETNQKRIAVGSIALMEAIFGEMKKLRRGRLAVFILKILYYLLGFYKSIEYFFIRIRLGFHGRRQGRSKTQINEDLKEVARAKLMNWMPKISRSLLLLRNLKGDSYVDMFLERISEEGD